ncbi:MAG: type II toxin-antitoxin system RelE/ParE family toxin [Candidatus Hydrogenedentes bacterium]|nr:type II toxin-antitoxin system RelE/ParE family toxin [Candidatus Hydrogenedentota bacterium]
MVEVRWTPRALDDLEAIAEFIAIDSPHFAQLFATDVFAAAERLAYFPASGGVVPETDDPAVREIVFGSYRIVYRCAEERVDIVLVHHGARLLDPTKFN